MRLEDPYAAWCLDEAVADAILRAREGQRLKPESGSEDEPKGNLELIRRIKEELGMKQA